MQAVAFSFWTYMNAFACLRGVLEEAFKNTFLLKLHAACALTPPWAECFTTRVANWVGYQFVAGTASTKTQMMVLCAAKLSAN